jgi:hypothetical protein
MNFFVQTSESSDSNATDNNSESKPAEMKEQKVTPSEAKEENNANVVKISEVL